jgi:hypothetical protein
LLKVTTAPARTKISAILPIEVIGFINLAFGGVLFLEDLYI